MLELLLAYLDLESTATTSLTQMTGGTERGTLVGGRALEVSLSAARTGDELPSLSPLTQSRLSAIQLEQSIQSSRPCTPQAVVGSCIPGSSLGTQTETEEETELREAFELDEMLVCGVGYAPA